MRTTTTVDAACTGKERVDETKRKRTLSLDGKRKRDQGSATSSSFPIGGASFPAHPPSR